MNNERIDDILAEWTKDGKLDDLKLDEESLRIPSLHGKYLTLLSRSRRVLRSNQLRRRELIRELRAYYFGECDDEALAKLERQQFQGRVLKGEVMGHVESDKKMLSLDAAIASLEDTVDVLTEIMRSVNNRGFAIKNAIDHRKLLLGG